MGPKPDTPFKTERWKELRSLADRDGLVPLAMALANLEPVRTLDGNRERAIKSDLRAWSNPKDHGTNSQDMGWLKLRFISDP